MGMLQQKAGIDIRFDDPVSLRVLLQYSCCIKGKTCSSAEFKL
jgi:hypothetical protein